MGNRSERPIKKIKKGNGSTFSWQARCQTSGQLITFLYKVTASTYQFAFQSYVLRERGIIFLTVLIWVNESTNFTGWMHMSIEGKMGKLGHEWKGQFFSKSGWNERGLIWWRVS